MQLNLGDAIRELREGIGINPPELAGRCGVTPQHIYDIESGKRNPSLKLLHKMAEILETEKAPLLALLRRKKDLIKRVRSHPERFESLMGEEKND